MKGFIFIIILLLKALPIFSQSEFKKSLIEISADLSSKLSKKGKSKVVILYITDVNKSNTVAGKYLADKISVNIVNDAANFQVFDRENLSGIVEAKKMMAEGYIDVDRAKELGKLLSVDAIIIGSYTILSKTIDLTLKALDSSTGFVIAASSNELPLDSDAGALLGINIASPNNGANINDGNRGFNDQPINSNERYNNPETVAKDCKEKNTGDYCFYNSTKDTLCVSIYRPRIDQYARFLPGETQCFYNLEASTYEYYIESGTNKRLSNIYSTGKCSYWLISKGQISVEICKSKTFTIK